MNEQYQDYQEKKDRHEFTMIHSKKLLNNLKSTKIRSKDLTSIYYTNKMLYP